LVTERNGMRTIWFFVGVILTGIGGVVLCAGVWDLVFSSGSDVRLANLHANIWWGAAILVTGAIYVVKNRNKYISM